MSRIVPISSEDPILRTFMLFMQLTNIAVKYVDSQFFHEHRISMITFVALKGLLMNGGTMTHTEMARWTNTKKHNITTLVKRMERQQFVTTERNTKDTRVIDVKITDVGRELYEKAVPTSHKTMDAMMQGFSKKDALELERLLNIIKENVEKS